MKHFNVHFTEEAEQDLFELYQYMARADSPERAEAVIDRLEKGCMTLERFPLRGHVPPELESVHMSICREIILDPYRVIYQVSGQDVFVYAVLDGRRHVQSLLEKRLLH